MALLPLIVALLACPVASRRTAQPNYTEWKEQKANASAAAAAAVAKEKKMAAVNKVTELMVTLQEKLTKEMENENKTYVKFTWFCEDTGKDKRAAIRSGEDEATTLAAKIEQLESTKKNLETRIQTLTDDIATAEGEMADARSARAGELKTYTTNAEDLKAALAALEGAIKSVKSSKGPALAQFAKGAPHTLRTALLLADALGLSGGGKLAALLQQAPEVAMEDYKFHSDSIISTLESLLDKFRKKKVEVDQAEVASVQAHDVLMQEKTNTVKVKNLELNDARERKAKTEEEIASTTTQLKTTQEQLAMDKEYLQDLLKMCQEKADTYAQRSKMRTDELAMLGQVIAIIGGEVSNKTTAATIRFNQQGVSVRLARAVASSESAVEAMEAEAEGVEASQGSALAFLQQNQSKPLKESFLSRRAGHTPEDEGRAAVAALLRREGGKLKSALLTSLAGRISNSEDPFAKVKILIQELLDRLLQEANAEENQKGWCDKSMSEAKQRRDYAAQKIEELNGEMADLEATRDKLAQELAQLADEIAELKTARQTAQQMRDEESAENAATVQEAEEGMSALDQAMTIVDRFYKTAAKANVTYSLAQRGPEDDAPDAGFDNGDAYLGAQGESTGILGMMEVMKGDFARTVSETQAQETQAQQEHLEFMTESGKSLAEKTTAESERTAQKSSTEDKLTTADDAMTAQSNKLQTALQELLELKPVCIDTGMTYADRVAAREEEIAALKQAECILHNYEQYGPGGGGGSC